VCEGALVFVLLRFKTTAKRSIRRSGVSAERRILQENELSGFLPKAATPVLQRSQIKSSSFRRFHQPARQIPMTVHGAAQPK